jgi:hypothetical protein
MGIGSGIGGGLGALIDTHIFNSPLVFSFVVLNDLRLTFVPL